MFGKQYQRRFQADEQGHIGGNVNPIRKKLKRILFEFAE